MKDERSYNERLKAAGIKTYKADSGLVFLIYKDIIMPRPQIHNVESECLKVFGVKI